MVSTFNADFPDNFEAFPFCLLRRAQSFKQPQYVGIQTPKKEERNKWNCN